MSGSNITIDMRGLDARIKRLKQTEIPSAMRNTINDLMRDVVKREQERIQAIFDKPTPYIVKSPAIKTKATKTSFMGEVWLRGEKNVLKPHIPGYSPRRDLKGIEALLRKRGQLGNWQYLIPSSSMKLDRFGNVSLATLKKMGADLSGKGKANTFVWGNVNGLKGVVSSVWYAAAWRARKPGALALLAVNAEPAYSKVYDFYGIAKSWAKQRGAYHARRAIEQQIAKRNR
jgi:hypothetical protein